MAKQKIHTRGNAMTTDLLFNFPRTKFVSDNTYIDQALHIHSEGKEIRAAVAASDINHLDEEVMDCLHSCETYLRMRSERDGLDIRDLMYRVAEKNDARGYYDAN
jgi:NTP pyrophosphatase (non-canonical NTP hydrolase)